MRKQYPTQRRQQPIVVTPVPRRSDPVTPVPGTLRKLCSNPSSPRVRRLDGNVTIASSFRHVRGVPGRPNLVRGCPIEIPHGAMDGTTTAGQSLIHNRRFLAFLIFGPWQRTSQNPQSNGSWRAFCLSACLDIIFIRRCDR